MQVEKYLQFKKVDADRMTTYEQVVYMRSFDTFTCNESNTQISKRLDKDVASEIIDLLKNGDTVILP